MTDKGYTGEGPKPDPSRDRLDNGLYFFEDSVDYYPNVSIISTFIWNELGPNKSIPAFVNTRDVYPYFAWAFAQIAFSKFVPDFDYHEATVGCPFDYNDLVRGIDTWFERGTLFLPSADCELCSPIIRQALDDGSLPIPALNAVNELFSSAHTLARHSAYLSVFISYGEPDRVLAERLRAELISKGVQVWAFAADAHPGGGTWSTIAKARQAAERFVLLCSTEALKRDAVLHELESQIDEAADRIIPVLLDDGWLTDSFPIQRGARDLKQWITSRIWIKYDPRRHKKFLARLLSALPRH